MSISFGNKNVKEMYFGNKKVAKVYFGNQLIWPKTRTPVAFDSNCAIYMDDTALANNIFKWGVRNNQTGEDLTWEIGRTNYWLYGPDGELIENRGTTALSRDINDLPDGTYQISLNCVNGYISNNKIPDSGTVSFNLTKGKVWKHKYMLEFSVNDVLGFTQFVFTGGSLKINDVLLTTDQIYNAEMYNPYLPGGGDWQAISEEVYKGWVEKQQQFTIDQNYPRIYLNSDVEFETFKIDSGANYEPLNGKTVYVDVYEIVNGNKTKIGTDSYIANGIGSTPITYTISI